MVRQGTSSAAGDARRRSPRDLRSLPFPEIRVIGPGQQREALDSVRRWAEQQAEDTIEWYYQDKRLKRIGSRVVRGCTIVLAVAGTAVPLASTAVGGSWQGWGYVLLALAAGCKGFDHFFGLSAGWMRDVSSAQALRSRLDEFRLGWTTEDLRAASHAALPADGARDTADLELRMRLITELIGAVHARLESETATWMVEFASADQQLRQDGGLAGAPTLPSPAPASER
ncbi:SLATT domain-containing protein [Streptomyces sp. NPDC005648]|uniref:SLATT domain-containing protein n=1 Tax=Streptomyces sp. NPDC005648 TaxID=3157044 RepID=UPI0033B199E5